MFHVSDSISTHSFPSGSNNQPAEISEIWSHIQPNAPHFPCLEFHLDLRSQLELTGLYHTPHGDIYGDRDYQPRAIPLGSILETPFALHKRLQVAAIFASSLQRLLDTPFLWETCGKEDFLFLTSKPLSTTGSSAMEAVYLQKELDIPTVNSRSVSVSETMTLADLIA